MSQSLAVFAPLLGARSETFIRRHANDLLPGRTVFVAREPLSPQETAWQPAGSSFVLANAVERLPSRLMAGLRRRLTGRTADFRLRRMAAFLRQHDVGVVLGEYLNASLSVLRFLHGGGLRLWVHAHGFDISGALRDPQTREAYRWYAGIEGIITISEVSRQRLVDLGLPATKVRVVPYGVDVPPEPIARARSRKIRCLAVGRMVTKKAPIFLLDAFRRAAASMPDLTLDYVGAGPLFPAVHQFLKVSGLGDRVTLHGGLRSEQVAPLLRDATIYLQHSIVDPETGDEEGLPVAILEAMAHGMAVVSTRHAGIPEAIMHNETGLLVDEGDTAAMAEAIVELARDPDRRQAMGLRAWRRAWDHFRWERERTELVQLLFPGSTQASSPKLESRPPSIDPQRPVTTVHEDR